MREVWRMWRYSTMVVLTAFTAATYAAILIPFKGIPLVPGFSEIRPANVIPLTFGLLFGPAGAWGAALGNLIGDFFGTLGVGSLFGFAGNFLAALLPYQMWGDRSLNLGRASLPYFLLAGLLGALGCALVISSGLQALGLLPFSVMALAVMLNNGLVSLSLSPLLLRLLWPRVNRWHLGWREIMDEEDRRPGPAPRLGLALLWLGAAGGWLVGMTGSLLPAAFSPWPLSLVLLPFLAALAAGCCLR
jgi:energy-coupling factor transport system substrate-specific component